MQKRSNKIASLVMCAMLVALYFVFSVYLSINIPNVIQISLSSLPVLLAAFLFGLPEALAVAFCGAFLEQVMFGLGPTTPIWMLPAVLQALVAGILIRLFLRRREGRSGKQKGVLVVLIILISELVLTLANTGVLYLDARIIGYPVKALYLLLPTRLVNGLARAALSIVVVPPVVYALSRVVRRKVR